MVDYSSLESLIDRQVQCDFFDSIEIDLHFNSTFSVMTLLTMRQTFFVQNAGKTKFILKLI